MENQNTRLINPRENPSFNEIHTQETIFGKQSQFTVYNAILRRTSPQKRRSDITLRFLLLITSLRWSSSNDYIHPRTPLESIASTQRWKNLFISGTFRNSENPISDKKLVPSDRKGASAPSSFGETKTRQTNVSVTERHNLDDGWHANRWYLRSATFSAHHLWIGWTRIERCTGSVRKKYRGFLFFPFFFWSPSMVDWTEWSSGVIG